MDNSIDQNLTTAFGNEVAMGLDDTSEEKSLSYLKKSTDIEGHIFGYIASTKAESAYEKKVELEKTEIEEKIEEILDVSDDLLKTTDNPVVRENLLDSLNELLNDLWEKRNYKEDREFSKFIVLIQSISKGKNIDVSNEKHIEALAKVLEAFKKPKISSVDIQSSVEIIEEVGLDIYKPMKKPEKLKITIERE